MMGTWGGVNGRLAKIGCVGKCGVWDKGMIIICAGVDKRLVVVGNVEYGIRDGTCAGRVDGILVVVGNVEYWKSDGICGGVDVDWYWWEMWSM